VLQEKQETASAPWEGLELPGRTQLPLRKNLVSQTINFNTGRTFISWAWHGGLLDRSPKTKQIHS
jgi:hypothetical protein